MSSGTRPPLEIITPDNQGPILVVYIVIASSISVVAILVRLFVAFRRKLGFRSDDTFIIAALVRLLYHSGDKGKSVHGHILAFNTARMSQRLKTASSNLINSMILAA
jgi:hypothetical protein